MAAASCSSESSKYLSLYKHPRKYKKESRTVSFKKMAGMDDPYAHSYTPRTNTRTIGDSSNNHAPKEAIHERYKRIMARSRRHPEPSTRRKFTIPSRPPSRNTFFSPSPSPRHNKFTSPQPSSTSTEINGEKYVYTDCPCDDERDPITSEEFKPGDKVYRMKCCGATVLVSTIKDGQKDKHPHLCPSCYANLYR
jgi:hypothetical protein